MLRAPVLIDGLLLENFEVTFSVNRDSGNNQFRFVFNATDKDDFDQPPLRKSRPPLVQVRRRAAGLQR